MFRDDAQRETESWRLRHAPAARATLGAWRWLGIARYAPFILHLCLGKRIIDFGGADGPLGLGSIIVDAKTPWGLDAFRDNSVDVVFTSHTLEHCADLTETLATVLRVLKPDGALIVHVPAWTCSRWLPENYPAADQLPHYHAFALANDLVAPAACIRLDALLMTAGLWLSLARYVGDNSILIIGRKRI